MHEQPPPPPHCPHPPLGRDVERVKIMQYGAALTPAGMARGAASEPWVVGSRGAVIVGGSRCGAEWVSVHGGRGRCWGTGCEDWMCRDGR